MNYKLLVEDAGKFIPALDEDGVTQIQFAAETAEEASAVIAEYQAENGKCFAAEVTPE